MTKALKVRVSGKNEVIAGADNALCIISKTEYFPATGKSNHHVYALVKPKPDERMYAEWQSIENDLIDNIHIEIVDSDTPDKIVKDRPSGTTWDSEDNLQDVCSFCKRRKDEVKKLVTSPGVSICNECIELAYETIA